MESRSPAVVIPDEPRQELEEYNAVRERERTKTQNQSDSFLIVILSKTDLSVRV